MPFHVEFANRVTVHMSFRGRSICKICLCWFVQEVVLPKDARLQPKIHLNLGIAQEQDGRLLAACDSYRYVLQHPNDFQNLNGAQQYSEGLHADRFELPWMVANGKVPGDQDAPL